MWKKTDSSKYAIWMLNLIPNCFKRSTIIIRKGQLMFQKGKTKYKEASSKKVKEKRLI